MFDQLFGGTERTMWLDMLFADVFAEARELMESYSEKYKDYKARVNIIAEKHPWLIHVLEGRCESDRTFTQEEQEDLYELIHSANLIQDQYMRMFYALAYRNATNCTQFITKVKLDQRKEKVM